MNLVCIGYRWPSEQMGRPARSVFSAAPLSLIWLLVAALLLLGIGTLLTIGAFHTLPERTIWRSLSYTFYGLLLAIPVTVFFLRIAVYFRDAYRAAHYGVPDLVEVIRQLDKAANQPTPGRIRQARIKISFIGHSMGAFVVTNLVRILSDVFDPASIGTLSTDDPHKAPGPEIGNVFTLGRLVLVSPDIPAETLLLRRANFLASSLRRFEESYLFSSEGDEALRLISTMANYFSFPTKSRDNGFRMGNTEVVSPDYGIVNLERLSQESPTGEARLSWTNSGWAV